MNATVEATTELFRHEALLYAGETEFLSGTVPFLTEGAERREAMLVAVTTDKIDLLRRHLGALAAMVTFVDMATLGRNPARIIPAWREFVDEYAVDGQLVRGIGEPVFAGDTALHLLECQVHEELLNTAFCGLPAWRLMCPYDTAALDAEVIEEACRSHPYVVAAGNGPPPAPLAARENAALRLDAPLVEPGHHTGDLAFGPDGLHRVRALVGDFAQRSGMDPHRTEALVVCANELALNSLQHGGGAGVCRAWKEGDYVICEVRDRGAFDDPLVGRYPPRNWESRGLWLVNRLCDLVQIRSYPEGSVVRLHMAIAGQAEMRLTQLTQHDQLTGVGNRALLRDRLEHALAVASRDGRQHAVLFCDLDGFKPVNDTYGHRVGDEVLIAIAARLREGARPADTIARLGGDEFVVLCEELSNEGDATVIADRVAKALDLPVTTSAGPLSISVSMGVALSRQGQSADDLLAAADAAMYAEKRRRRSNSHS